MWARPVEKGDAIVVTAMLIDGAGMGLAEYVGRLDAAHLVTILVQDAEGVLPGGTQRQLEMDVQTALGVDQRLAVAPRRHELQQFAAAQLFQQIAIVGGHGADLGHGKGQFAGGAEQVPEPHVRILQVHHRQFVGLAKERLGMGEIILIQRILRPHHEHQGVAAPAAGAAGLLPGGHDGARIAGDNGGVEAADVDAPSPERWW